MPNSDTPTRLLLPGEQEALDFLAEVQAEEFKPEEERQPFTIMRKAAGDPVRAAGLADYLLQVYAQAEDAEAQVKAIAQAARDKADAWEADQLVRAKQEKERLAGHLRVYATDAYPSSTRTIRLPSGDLKRRAGFDSLKLGDEAEILDWLRTHDPDGWDDLVKLKPKLDLTAFKKRLDKSGGYVVYKPTGEYVMVEDVEGDVAVEKKLATYETTPDSFSVKPKPRALPSHQEDNDGND